MTELLVSGVKLPAPHLLFENQNQFILINTLCFKVISKLDWRNLLKNKGYSLINIGGLAVGMAVAMLIGFWIQDELSFNRYHQNYATIGKVYRLNNWGEGIEASTSQVVGLGSLLPH